MDKNKTKATSTVKIAKHPFNIEKEFPNHFKIALEGICKTLYGNSERLTDKQYAKGLSRLKRLMEHYINSVVQRLNLPYVQHDAQGKLIEDNNGKPKIFTEGFFDGLIDAANACIPNDKKNTYEVRLYLGGGVIRTLIAHMYKEFHESNHAWEQRDTNKVSAKEKYLTSTRTLAFNNCLKALEKLVNNQGIFDSNSEAFIQALPSDPTTGKPIPSIKDFFIQMQPKELLRLVQPNQDSIYEEKLQSWLLLQHPNPIDDNQVKTKESLLEATYQAEYKLLSNFIAHTEDLNGRLISSFILGSGSDFDTYVEVIPKNSEPVDAFSEHKETTDATTALSNSTAAQKAQANDYAKQICETCEKFINGAENAFGLSKMHSKLKHSFVPRGDVCELNTQRSEAIAQGGSMIDTMAFRLVKSDPTLNKALPEIILPSPEAHTSANKPLRFKDIFETMIKGEYEYILPTDDDPDNIDLNAVPQKQTIRGLRTLVEMPFLRLDAASEKILSEELINILNSLSPEHPLQNAAKEQIEKLKRNAHFGGANNRVHREDGVLRLFSELVIKAGRLSGLELQHSFPEYAQIRSTKTTPGQFVKELAPYLITTSDFIEKRCSEKSTSGNGVLYHGTPDIENLLPILRNGFYLSGRGQGLDFYGPGVYASTDFSLAKNNYAGSKGAVIKLEIDKHHALKILDMKTLISENPDLLKKIAQESTSKGYRGDSIETNDVPEDVNELLSLEYGIDIIVNTHIIIQNLDAVVRPKDIGAFIEATVLKNIYDFSIKKAEETLHLLSLASALGLSIPKTAIADAINTVLKEELHKTSSSLNAIQTLLAMSTELSIRIDPDTLRLTEKQNDDFKIQLLSNPSILSANMSPASRREEIESFINAYLTNKSHDLKQIGLGILAAKAMYDDQKTYSKQTTSAITDALFHAENIMHEAITTEVLSILSDTLIDYLTLLETAHTSGIATNNHITSSSLFNGHQARGLDTLLQKKSFTELFIKYFNFDHEAITSSHPPVSIAEQILGMHLKQTKPVSDLNAKEEAINLSRWVLREHSTQPSRGQTLSILSALSLLVADSRPSIFVDFMNSLQELNHPLTDAMLFEILTNKAITAQRAGFTTALNYILKYRHTTEGQRESFVLSLCEKLTMLGSAKALDIVYQNLFMKSAPCTAMQCNIIKNTLGLLKPAQYSDSFIFGLNILLENNTDLFSILSSQGISIMDEKFHSTTTMNYIIQRLSEKNAELVQQLINLNKSYFDNYIELLDFNAFKIIYTQGKYNPLSKNSKNMTLTVRCLNLHSADNFIYLSKQPGFDPNLSITAYRQSKPTPLFLHTITLKKDDAFLAAIVNHPTFNHQAPALLDAINDLHNEVFHKLNIELLNQYLYTLNTLQRFNINGPALSQQAPSAPWLADYLSLVETPEELAKSLNDPFFDLHATFSSLESKSFFIENSFLVASRCNEDGYIEHNIRDDIFDALISHPKFQAEFSEQELHRLQHARRSLFTQVDIVPNDYSFITEAPLTPGLVRQRAFSKTPNTGTIPSSGGRAPRWGSDSDEEIDTSFILSDIPKAKK